MTAFQIAFSLIAPIAAMGVGFFIGRAHRAINSVTLRRNCPACGKADHAPCDACCGRKP